MKTIEEIETAIKRLPLNEKWEIALRLLEDLQETAPQQPCISGGRVASLPDYGARRRRTFGEKVLPNMVMVARGEERW